MKIKSILFLCILLVIGVNLAAVEVKVDHAHWVETERFNEDYLFTGNYLEFQGETRDLFAFAEQIDFSGKSSLALTAAARQIYVAGNVGNGVKAAGRTIIMKGTSTGTNFLGAESVIFESESQTTGDTFIGARQILVKGKISGDLYAGAGEVSIQNEIHGNVKVYAGQLKIEETGKIIGNLIYYSDHPLSIEEAARVTGNITFEKKEGGFFDDTYTDDIFNGTLIFSILFKLSFAILGFLLLLFPATRFLEKRLTHKQILSHSLWGLIPIFIYPTAFVISILLVITIPLAVSLLFAFVPVLFVTKIIGITAIGGFITNALDLRTKSRYLFFLIGIILYSLLSLIPVFGFLLMVFVSAIGCGIVLSALLQKRFV
ncbi:polymer-forming cytoskeletal protein [bacterium]|nr:polymer-forming cytoskeletal protein [bacterium]